MTAFAGRASALGRCDTSWRGRLPGPGARRRRRGPEGLRAARGARRATVLRVKPTICQRELRRN
jgi:hypothetical protein